MYPLCKHWRLIKPQQARKEQESAGMDDSSGIKRLINLLLAA